MIQLTGSSSNAVGPFTLALLGLGGLRPASWSQIAKFANESRHLRGNTPFDERVPDRGVSGVGAGRYSSSNAEETSCGLTGSGRHGAASLIGPFNQFGSLG